MARPLTRSRPRIPELPESPGLAIPTADPPPEPFRSRMKWRVNDYDLAGTLESGQVFRWRPRDGGWEGVVDSRWIRLRSEENAIVAEVAEPVTDWRWLGHFLQIEQNLGEVLRTFPDDGPMRAAVAACRGLRLLRQEPWECLTSFICSSTKQIVQIKQIVAQMSERFGDPIAVPAGEDAAFSFPSAERIAALEEGELRGCKMGFRAPFVLATARAVTTGEIDLGQLGSLSVSEARAQLMELPGVGRKVADCVLLFAYGCQDAFPVDVWVQKALRRLYFPRRRVSARRLHQFTSTHFRPWSGYAQQYLFHYMRVHSRHES